MRRRNLLRGLGAGMAVTAFSTGISTAQAGGTERWRFQTGGAVLSPAVADGTVFAGSHDDGLYAVDAVDGSEEWHFETVVDPEPPAVADGTVYVGSLDSNLYAVDAVDGSEEWHFETGNGISTSPTVADGTVYVGGSESETPNGQLYAIDVTDGRQQWRFELGTVTRAAPAVADGTVYIGRAAGPARLYAIDAVDGSEEWRFETGNRIHTSPTVADGTVYVGSHDRHLYAVDAASGEEEWAFEAGGSVKSSPTVVDGTVYVGSGDYHLYAVDAGSGEEEWRFEASASIESSPAVADGTVYVGSYDNNLYAVDAASGREEWRFETGRPVSSPAVADGAVYVGSLDNNLYAVNTGGSGSSGGSGENPSAGNPPSESLLSPQSVAFGRTIAGTTETVPLTVSAPAAESVRVQALETPSSVAVARDCAFALGFLRYGCAPTPPFDVPAGGSKEVTLRLRAPLRGIVTSIDGAATLRTPTGSTSVPITATSLADTVIVRDFERTAREFATFLGTGSDARLAAVGDDVVGMYEDVIQLVGKRAGRQYRDALEEAKEAGNKLQQAGEGLNTKQFITDWEASARAPDASPQPGQLQADFLTIADTLSKCRADIEADDLEGAVDHAQDVEGAVTTVADDVQTAYQELDTTMGGDVEEYLADFVAAVEAYEAVVAGPESTSS